MPNANDTFELTAVDAEAIVSAWLGRAVRCEPPRRLIGGICYWVGRLRFDAPPHTAVVKIDANPLDIRLDAKSLPIGPGADPAENAAGSFGREAVHLEIVRSLGDFPAPRLLWRDDSRTRLPFSYMIIKDLPGRTLETLRLGAEERSAVERDLAEFCLRLHAHTRAEFGDVRPSARTRRWADIMVPRLAELREDLKDRLPAETLADIDLAIRHAADVLAEQGEPTLVHGDLWAANLLADRDADGRWRLSGVLDWPALQYADVEYELAYLEAWRTVGEAFLDRYCAQRPMRPGYPLRRLYYHLHTYMLHVWLEGHPSQVRQAAACARRLAKAVEDR